MGPNDDGSATQYQARTPSAAFSQQAGGGSSSQQLSLGAMGATSGAHKLIPPLGTSLNVISTAGIRYTGKLSKIQLDDDNITLADVAVHGTENRNVPGHPPSPASEGVYDYITFRLAYVKELRVADGEDFGQIGVGGSAGLSSASIPSMMQHQQQIWQQYATSAASQKIMGGGGGGGAGQSLYGSSGFGGGQGGNMNRPLGGGSAGGPKDLAVIGKSAGPLNAGGGGQRRRNRNRNGGNRSGTANGNTGGNGGGARPLSAGPMARHNQAGVSHGGQSQQQQQQQQQQRGAGQQQGKQQSSGTVEKIVVVGANGTKRIEITAGGLRQHNLNAVLQQVQPLFDRDLQSSPPMQQQQQQQGGQRRAGGNIQQQQQRNGGGGGFGQRGNQQQISGGGGGGGGQQQRNGNFQNGFRRNNNNNMNNNGRFGRNNNMGGGQRGFGGGNNSNNNNNNAQSAFQQRQQIQRRLQQFDWNAEQIAAREFTYTNELNNMVKGNANKTGGAQDPLYNPSKDFFDNISRPQLGVADGGIGLGAGGVGAGGGGDMDPRYMNRGTQRQLNAITFSEVPSLGRVQYHPTDYAAKPGDGPSPTQRQMIGGGFNAGFGNALSGAGGIGAAGMYSGGASGSMFNTGSLLSGGGGGAGGGFGGPGSMNPTLPVPGTRLRMLGLNVRGTTINRRGGGNGSQFGGGRGGGFGGGGGGGGFGNRRMGGGGSGGGFRNNNNSSWANAGGHGMGGLGGGGFSSMF